MNWKNWDDGLTDGLLGNPTRWPHVFSRLTNLSRTLHWLIQGRFQPENEAESAAVNDSDLLGDKVLDVAPEPPWHEPSFLFIPLAPPCNVLLCWEFILSLLKTLLDPIVDALDIDPSILVLLPWPPMVEAMSNTEPPDAAPKLYNPCEDVSVAVEAIE